MTLGIGDEALFADARQGSVHSDQAWPSFFIVGPPRTGSTWLYDVLASHTNLPSPTKETRFYDRHFSRGAEWYQHHFQHAVAGRPVGEVAPTYFCSEQARENIARTAPGAKIVFTFREPVQRVVSLYRVKRAYGLAPWSFEEALERDPELLESGRYATHLRKWCELFPKEQLLVTLYDDLRKTPQAYLKRLCEFLAIPEIRLTETDLRRVHSSDRMTEPRSYYMTRMALAVADWCKARKLDHIVASVRESRSMKFFIGGGAPFPELSEKAKAKAVRVFAPEIEMLEKMIDRDLSSWRPHWASDFQQRPLTAPVLGD